MGETRTISSRVAAAEHRPSSKASAGSTSTAAPVCTPGMTPNALAASAPESGDLTSPPDVEILPAPPMLDAPEGVLPTIPPSASRRRFSDEQQRILRQPIPSDDLDILPTGELYASQVRYRRILTDAFGAGGWALLPLTPYCRANNTLVRTYALYCEGQFVSEATGEADYYEKSTRQTWATVAESVKSNALVRCCKDLTIGSECWDSHFCETFKQNHCVRVLIDVQEQGVPKVKAVWRRRDGRPFPRERGLADDAAGGMQLVRTPRALPDAPNPRPEPEAVNTTPAEENTAPARDTPEGTITEAQQRRLFAIVRKGRGIKALRDHLAEKYGLESTEFIPMREYDAICTWAAFREPGSEG